MARPAAGLGHAGRNRLVVANIVYSGGEVRESMFQGEASYRAFEVASGDDWMTLGCASPG